MLRGSRSQISGNVNPSDVMHLHQETDEVLAHTLDDRERENAKLKKRIDKIEVALILLPLLAKPPEIVHPIEESPVQARKIDRIIHLLLGVIYFVEESIKERTYLISKAFEIIKNVHKIGTHLEPSRNI